MKTVRWAQCAWGAASLLIVGILAGCSGFWDKPPNNGGGGGNTTLTSSNFYILNQSSIYGAYILKGVLTALSGSPYAVNGQAYSMAVEPGGTFAYVGSSSGIYLYTIDANTGALTASTQISQDPVPYALAVDPTGAWLLDASGQGSGSLSAIPITSTGALDSTRSTQTVALSGQGVHQMAIAPNGAWVFLALGTSGTEAFNFTSGNKAPLTTTAIKIAPSNTASGSALSIAVDPQSRLLYIGESAVFPNSSSSSGGLRAFTIAANSLKELTSGGSPYPSGGGGPHAILAEGGGAYVFVANWNGTSAGNVTGFSVATTGLTKASSTASTGNQPVSLVEDMSRTFALVVNSTDSTSLDAFDFDTTTAGKLDLGLTATTSTTGTNPVAVVPER